MKQYTKDGVIRQANKIVINKDGFVTTNPTEEMILADGWVEYVKPAPTPEQLLAKAKRDKKAEIEDYDKSEEVNLFYIGEAPMWLNKETRTGLMLRFNAEIAIGKTDTTLWADGVQYPLPLETAIQMLYALEVYASMCYDNTQAHLAAVDALTTIEEVEAYDHTTNYPEKLKF